MEAIRVIEPRVNIKADVEKNHVVLMGGMRVNQQINPADSWGSPGVFLRLRQVRSRTEMSR
jgi:hypothetical protein